MLEKQQERPVFWLQIATVLLGITGLLAYAVSKFTSGRLIVIITVVGFLGFLMMIGLLAFRLKHPWKILRSVAISLLAVVICTYLLLFLSVISFQDAIANHTSSFFQPKRITTEAARSLIAPDVTEILIPMQDGIILHGWLVRNSTEARTPLVIYFGGSGSEASEIVHLARKLTGWSVALINYRGFGLSEGTPTHEKALTDALAIYDVLTARDDIDSRRVVSMGYSLGTGVAVYLSEQRPLAGTILVSPYEQWTLIGLKQSPIYAPLEGFLKPYFDSLSRAPMIKLPMFCLVGSEDTFVPPALSLELVEAWGGEARVITYQGEDHGLLFHDNNSWNDILGFLQSLEQK
ncbi:MAG: alpha/beta hydrolase [Chloroflexota bacterium]